MTVETKARVDWNTYAEQLSAHVKALEDDIDSESREHAEREAGLMKKLVAAEFNRDMADKRNTGLRRSLGKNKQELAAAQKRWESLVSARDSLNTHAGKGRGAQLVAAVAATATTTGTEVSGDDEEDKEHSEVRRKAIYALGSAVQNCQDAMDAASKEFGRRGVSAALRGGGKGSSHRRRCPRWPRPPTIDPLAQVRTVLERLLPRGLEASRGAGT